MEITYKYDKDLDRLVRCWYNCTHEFVLDEMELGARVALALNDQNNGFWCVQEQFDESWGL